ncbi:MAG: efflux RND transporter permease subunit [Bacteroidia bacterium]
MLRWSKHIIIGITLISVVCVFLASRLGFDYNFENYFPKGDPELEFFLQYREKFDNDNDYVLIGLKNNAGIFQKDFLQKIVQLTDSLREIPYIENVTSPVNLKQIIVGPLGPVEVPYLHPDEEERYGDDSAKVYSNKELVGTFFSPQGKAVTILLKTAYNPSKEKSDIIAESVKKTVTQFQFDETHIAGKVIAQKVYIDKMQWELMVFISIAIVLIIIFLYVAFKALWAILIPLVVVFISVLWLLGFMSITNQPIDLLMTLMPTIMFVVGMSDVVHIITRYVEELRIGRNKRDALNITIKEVGLATFFTSFTTAVGFITLITIKIKPVQQFGWYMAAGVFFAFVVAFTLLPSILLYLKTPRVAEKSIHSVYWNKILRGLFVWIIRNQKKIVSTFVLLVIIAFIGISKIEINNYILEDLRDSDPLKKDFVYFEENFSGVRPFELYLKSSDSSQSLLSLEALKEIEKIQFFLETEYGTGFIVSPVTLVKTIYKALNGGGEAYYKLPESNEEMERVMAFIQKFKKRKEFASLISADNTEARITGKMHDMGSKNVAKKNQALEKFIAENINQKIITAQLTGSAHLIDKNNAYLARNLVGGLSIAFLIIALLTAIFYRSYVMVLIALIPNLIPLVFIAGIIGFAGIYLKISTGIIFTIAFGIAVDDTIHFLSKLKLELDKGKSLVYAVKRTFLSTGKAIIITSIILCGGFLSLILSSFEGTFLVGLLISLTLLFAVIADLFLLPILIFAWYKRRRIV